MDDSLRLRGSVAIPPGELRWRFSRSGGPGGQSVNTSDSRVELSFDVGATRSLPPVWGGRALDRLSDQLVDGVLTVSAQEERSQYLNRKAALERLGAIMRDATAPPPRPRRPTKPSRSSVQRRLDAKKRRGRTKRDRRPPEP